MHGRPRPARRRPGAYLRGFRTWAPGSTCSQTGRYPPAPWQGPRTAAAERGEPARRGSCRDPDGNTNTGTGTRGRGRGDGHRDTAPPPRASRGAAPVGAGGASNAACHWRGPARPEPIPAAPAARWRRGTARAGRSSHVGAHGCSPGRAGRPRAAAAGRAHPEVPGPGRVSLSGEAPQRQTLAPPCRAGAARGGVRGRAAAAPLYAGAGARSRSSLGVCVR